MLKDACQGGGTVDTSGSNPDAARRESSTLSPGTQKCNNCGETKPLDAYSVGTQRNGAGRIRKECKVCIAAKARERRARNPEKYRKMDLLRKEMLKRSDPIAFREGERDRKRYARDRKKLDGEFVEGAHELIDGKPFQDWLASQLAAGKTYESLSGPEVSPRSLRRAHKEQVRVSLSVADRVLMWNDRMLWEFYD